MNNKYIITGGLGFIGSNLVRYINDNHDSLADLVVCDRVRADRYKNIAGARIVDMINPDELFEYVDANRYSLRGIFHLGACSDTMNFGDEVMEKNFVFTRRLMNLCATHKISLVYASSASVYGTNSDSSEDRKEEPLNLYAFSKSMVDQYFRSAMKNHGKLRVMTHPTFVGLRYFNVYGPQERHKGRMASVIFQKYQEFKENGYIKLFTPGTQRRDFIHVEDVCKVTWAAMHTGKVDIFNVGTGEAPSFNDVAKAIIESGASPSSNPDYLNDVKKAGYRTEQLIHYVDFPQELKGRYQDYTCADTTNLRTWYTGDFLNYREGIKKAIEAYEVGL